MIEIRDQEKCCGCSACASICTHNAISMIPDALGFLYPKVNVDLCTNCGLCERVCAFNTDYDVCSNLQVPLAYCARQKNLDEVRQSRSGAIFAALSDYVFQKGGVVYGAGYASHFRVVHKRATDKKERDEFRGSKYVQSDINNTFSQIKKDLKDGIFVLFSGTPCQTAGLASFLGKKLCDKLLLVDIVCHGTSSPKVWDDYLSYIERKENSEIVKVNFRNKTLFGWHAHKETYDFINGKTMWYRYKFYNEIHMRKSCNVCPFSNTKRPSDITLGDFWGYEKKVPNMVVDNLGYSLVYCNTGKGKDIFSAIKDLLIFQEVGIDFTLQPNLSRPTQVHRKREDFENVYSVKGFEVAAKKFGLIGFRYFIDKITILVQRVL